MRGSTSSTSGRTSPTPCTSPPKMRFRAGVLAGLLPHWRHRPERHLLGLAALVNRHGIPRHESTGAPGTWALDDLRARRTGRRHHSDRDEPDRRPEAPVGRGLSTDYPARAAPAAAGGSQRCASQPGINPAAWCCELGSSSVAGRLDERGECDLQRVPLDPAGGHRGHPVDRRHPCRIRSALPRPRRGSGSGGSRPDEMWRESTACMPPCCGREVRPGDRVGLLVPNVPDFRASTAHARWARSSSPIPRC